MLNIEYYLIKNQDGEFYSSGINSCYGVNFVPLHNTYGQIPRFYSVKHDTKVIKEHLTKLQKKNPTDKFEKVKYIMMSEEDLKNGIIARTISKEEIKFVLGEINGR